MSLSASLVGAQGLVKTNVSLTAFIAISGLRIVLL